MVVSFKNFANWLFPQFVYSAFQSLLKVGNIFFLKEKNINQQVFIIFILKSICIAFWPKVSRRKVPAYSPHPPLFTPHSRINYRNCSSVVSYFSLFSLFGKMVLLRYKYRYRYRLHLNKKQGESCETVLRFSLCVLGLEGL